MTDAGQQPDAQGDFIRYPVPRLLFYLYKKQVLGRLTIEQANNIRGNVYFRDGLPVYTDLPFSQDVLGRVLLERGLIDEAGFNASLHELATSGRLQGQILLEMGRIDQQGLVAGLRNQLHRKLNRLFSLVDASFAIYNGEHGQGLEGESAHVQADPLWVIYHGVRNSFTTDRMKAELDKLSGMMLSLPPEFERVRERYGLGDEVHNLLAILLRGAVPTNKLFGVSDIGATPTQMLIYSLWVTEVLVATPGRRTGAHPAVDHAAQVQAARRAPAGTPAEIQAPVVAAAPVSPEVRVRKGSVPGVAELAQGYGEEPTAAPVVMPPPDQESFDDVDVIKSVPMQAARAAVEVSPGQEGVYEIPVATETAAPITEARSQENVVSSPGSPGDSSAPFLKPVPESAKEENKQIAIDAGAAALHHNQIRKTFKQLESENFYQILGLNKTSTDDEIREAYFSMAKDFHPDRVKSLGLDDIAREAEEIFRAINDAHTTLIDPELRKEYDEELEGGGDKQTARDAFTAEFAFQKGLVHFRKKNFSEALKHFQEAYKLNPEEGDHLAYVSWTLYSDPKTDKKAMLPKVKEQLLKSIHISKNSAACHFFLGEVYLAMGEDRRAFTCFDKVLEINPDHLEAERHLRLLRMRREKKKKGAKGLFGRFMKKK